MRWPDLDAMTIEQAQDVRSLRCEGNGATWRYIAHHCAEKWGGGWDSNQIAGMEICGAAARLLGEDPNEPPWN